MVSDRLTGEWREALRDQVQCPYPDGHVKPRLHELLDVEERHGRLTCVFVETPGDERAPNPATTGHGAPRRTNSRARSTRYQRRRLQTVVAPGGMKSAKARRLLAACWILLRETLHIETLGPVKDDEAFQLGPTVEEVSNKSESIAEVVRRSAQEPFEHTEPTACRVGPRAMACSMEPPATPCRSSDQQYAAATYRPVGRHHRGRGPLGKTEAGRPASRC
jgi:hypothetical protein